MFASSEQLPGTGPIMIVDDDPFVREPVGDLLREIGYQVVLAEDGHRALTLLRGLSAPPRLILLDLMMPGMNGWQFLEERQKDASLCSAPVVVMSVAVDGSLDHLGVAGYLRKPFSEESLATLFQHLRAGQAFHDPGSAASGRHPPAALRVLLIQELDDEARNTEAQLSSVPGFSFQVERVRALDGQTPASLAETDVVLLDLDLTGHTGLSALEAVLRRAPHAALVVLASGPVDSREGAIQKGAQDIIAKRSQSPELLGRSIYHAFERKRLQTELERARELAAHERELRGLARWTSPQVSVASEVLGQSSLRQSLPARFQEHVGEFTRICQTAIAGIGYEQDNPVVRRALAGLATRLADLRVGPADIVDLYRAALASDWFEEDTELGTAKREEARLMLIGLLGNVLAHYRLYLGGSRPPTS